MFISKYEQQTEPLSLLSGFSHHLFDSTSAFSDTVSSIDFTFVASLPAK